MGENHILHEFFLEKERFPMKCVSKWFVNFVDIATVRQYSNKFDTALSQIAMLRLLRC